MTTKRSNPDDLECCIAEREAEILGKAPRIPPLGPNELDEEVALANYEKIRKASSGNTAKATLSETPELVMTLLRHPELYQRLSDVSVTLLSHGELAPRDRRLAVLRATWLCQSPYPFGEHVRHAKREGMTSEDVERVIAGSGAEGWNRHESAIIRAVEELNDNAMVCDETWSILAETLNDKQLFELTVLVGQFTLVAYFQNSLRLRLREENAGLRAR